MNITDLLTETERRAEAAIESNDDCAQVYIRDVLVLTGLLWRVKALLDNPLTDYPLDDRERRVCQELIAGKPVTEIAEGLSVTRATVYKIADGAVAKIGQHDARDYQRDDLVHLLSLRLGQMMGGEP